MDRYLLNYPKSVSTAYVLLGLLGIVGAHRFYTQRVGTGIVYVLTAGLLGVGVLVDLFTLAAKVDETNRRLSRDTVSA